MFDILLNKDARQSNQGFPGFEAPLWETLHKSSYSLCINQNLEGKAGSLSATVIRVNE